jgi:hypothetical protein
MTSWQEKKRLELLEERRKDHEKHAAERLASVNRICSLAVANGMTYGKYIIERDRIMNEENKVVEEAPRKHGGIREPLPPEKVERVKEMLAEGAKISTIIAETLVSRATIDRIKNGTYGEKRPKKKEPAAVVPETSNTRTDGVMRVLISRAVETLRDTQGGTPDDCALVGKALGLLEAVEMMMEGVKL